MKCFPRKILRIPSKMSFCPTPLSRILSDSDSSENVAVRPDVSGLRYLYRRSEESSTYLICNSSKC